MLIVIELKSFNNKHVYFGDKQINNMSEYCSFTSLYYSTELFTTNNILFEFPLLLSKIDINCNILNCYFDLSVESNKRLIQYITSVEHKLLTKYNLFNNKTPKCVLSNQMKKGFIKVILPYQKMDNYIYLRNIQILIRMSGIWENENNETGIIFKFLLKEVEDETNTTVYNSIPY